MEKNVDFEIIFENKFNQIIGKTIAIVYIFEGDEELGLKHFFIWKSDIITKWMNAVQELSCHPLIIDVRTFVDKAVNKTLPNIDYVINLNSGTYDLSTMALVPSVCSMIGVPCIPCDANAITAGENKHLSNLIAFSLGLNVPRDKCLSSKDGIFRPINLGNSIGVQKGAPSNSMEGIYQEFISGVEITTPLIFNPLTKRMDTYPSVAFLPIDYDINWFYDETAKSKQKGYFFKEISLSAKLEEKLISLTDSLSIKTYCRIDSRIKCESKKEMEELTNKEIPLSDAYFIEINVMPTIRDNNSFHYSFDLAKQNHKINHAFKNIAFLMGKVESLNIYNFLLANAMMATLD